MNRKQENILDALEVVLVENPGAGKLLKDLRDTLGAPEKVALKGGYSGAQAPKKEVLSYLLGCHMPMQKADLLAYARGNRAPERVIDRINRLYQQDQFWYDSKKELESYL